MKSPITLSFASWRLSRTFQQKCRELLGETDFNEKNESCPKLKIPKCFFSKILRSQELKLIGRCSRRKSPYFLFFRTEIFSVKTGNKLGCMSFFSTKITVARPWKNQNTGYSIILCVSFCKCL